MNESQPKHASRLAKVRVRLSKLASTLLLAGLGFALGALVFGRCSGETQSEHQRDTLAQVGKPSVWTCAMHPDVRQPEPGLCPICGMDLVPVAPQASSEAGTHPDRVVLSERARALAKLRTAPVRRQTDAAALIRLLGRFEPNETTLKTVTAWTGGRIDRLHVNVTGERVRAGQAVATVYSPEVFAAHQDLLVAKRQLTRMQQSPEASRLAAGAALDAARERLRLLGVPDDELVRMEGQERPTRSIALRTPFSGTVIERMATEGAYVTTGTPLLRVANLSSLWVQLDAYESDLSRLSVGQVVEVTVEALSGELFEGKVTFIDPTLDPLRRTAKVRVQVDNRDGRLRPGMFAQATVAAQEGDGNQGPLVVPATAPLFTGRRAIVYVEVPANDGVAYEPRTVRLGPRAGEVYPVAAGLAEGDRVVTRGAFALDADLQIRGGASMLSAGDDHDHDDENQVQLTAAQRQQLAPVVSAYLAVQGALADDDLAKAKKAATAMAEAVKAVAFDQPTEAKTSWSALVGDLSGHAKHVAMADKLEGARQGFEPLSGAVIGLLKRFGNPATHALHLAHCPMASGSDGAAWIQEGKVIDNSYFGAAMLTCGEVKQEIAPGRFLTSPETSRQAKPAAPGGEHKH